MINFVVAKRGVVVALGFGFCVVALLALPGCNLKIGDAFFGRYPQWYNLDVAQFFYQQAAHPIVGTPPKYAHYQLSRTYFIQGKLPQAATEAVRELERYPENVRTYYILGLTYGYMDMPALAVDAFAQFIQHHPNSWAARNDMAWLQFRMGDYEAALKTIQPVSEVLNPWVQNTYGVMLLNSGRYAEAHEAFVLAKENAALLTDERWGAAYPGNSPLVYGTGLAAMRETIDQNLELTKTHLSTP